MGAMHEFKVLDPNGHSSTTWDPDEAAAVERARKAYEQLLRRGYRPFGLRQGGETARLERFDPQEKEALLVPPLHGG